MQTFGKIAVSVKKGKILNNSSLKYLGSRISLLTLQKRLGALKKTQQLWLAQSQTPPEDLAA